MQRGQLTNEAKFPEICSEKGNVEKMENWKDEKVGQWEIKETLPKAQRTRGLSALTKITSLGHITSSNTNLDQFSASKL